MNPPGCSNMLLTRRQATLGLLAAGTALVLSPAGAQQAAESQAGFYAVEIVVVRGTGGTAGEDLAVAPRNLSQDNDATAAGTARSARLGEVLPASRRKLADVAGRLNASSGHRVIAHAAWTQTAGAWNAGSGLTAEQLGLSAAGLTGVVQLERGQYLHLGFNLSYAPAAGARYTLAEMRRIRVGERNYYDHPAYGIVAVVTPLTGAEAR